MKSIVKALPLVCLIVIAGCSDDGKQAKPENAVLKTQTDALKEAKSVDQLVEDAAAKQREAIEKGAK